MYPPSVVSILNLIFWIVNMLNSDPESRTRTSKVKRNTNQIIGFLVNFPGGFWI